ncbi:acetyl-CoA carboxylase biotin carboxylase subunit family protein [Streptomyces sp. NPDC096339]|uniref:ATP-grasp domain-containing protein n=1 Tax=Streptomyces sp. NPDC096339 TaxID=3366086 RepID=UPI00382A41ED
MKNIVLIGGHDETFTHCADLPLTFSVVQLAGSIGPNLRALTDDIHPVGDLEVETVVDAVGAILADKRVDHVFSFTEDGLLPAAVAAGHYGLPGISESSCRLCVDKSLMRDHLRGTEFDVASASCGSAAEVREFLRENPAGLVLKPPAGSGSEDVFVIHDEDDLVAAVTALGEGPFSMLAEEYLPGREVSVETLTIDGRHRLLAVTDKTLYRDTLAETRHIVTPDVVNSGTRELLAEFCARLLTLIGHEHGPCHIELKLDGDRIRLIEINNRVGGDYVGLLAELTTGVSMIRETVRFFAGESEPASAQGDYDFASSHLFYEPVDQDVLRANLEDVDIHRLHIGAAAPERHGPVVNDDKIGWVVFAARDRAAFDKAVEYLRHGFL